MASPLNLTYPGVTPAVPIIRRQVSDRLLALDYGTEHKYVLLLEVHPDHYQDPYREEGTYASLEEAEAALRRRVSREEARKVIQRASEDAWASIPCSICSAIRCFIHLFEPDVEPYATVHALRIEDDILRLVNTAAGDY